MLQKAALMSAELFPLYAIVVLVSWASISASLPANAELHHRPFLVVYTP
jgi:hypothetical protein